MIRFYCDICSKEIQQGENSGELKYVEKTTSFIKHQKEQAYKQTQILLCKTCLDELKEYFETKRKP